MKTIRFISLLAIFTLSTHVCAQISNMLQLSGTELTINETLRIQELEAEFNTLLQEAGYFESIDEPKKAIETYTRALEINPFNSSAYAKRGNCYMAINRLRKSANDIIKAIETDSTNAEAYTTLGKLHFINQNANLAIKAYNKALEIDPLYRPALFHRAMVYIYMDNEPMALNDLISASLLHCPKAQEYLELFFMQEYVMAKNE